MGVCWVDQRAWLIRERADGEEASGGVRGIAVLTSDWPIRSHGNQIFKRFGHLEAIGTQQGDWTSGCPGLDVNYRFARGVRLRLEISARGIFARERYA